MSSNPAPPPPIRPPRVSLAGARQGIASSSSALSQVVSAPPPLQRLSSIPLSSPAPLLAARAPPVPSRPPASRSPPPPAAAVLIPPAPLPSTDPLPPLKPLPPPIAHPALPPPLLVLPPPLPQLSTGVGLPPSPQPLPPPLSYLPPPAPPPPPPAVTPSDPDAFSASGSARGRSATDLSGMLPARARVAMATTPQYSPTSPLTIGESATGESATGGLTAGEPLSPVSGGGAVPAALSHDQLLSLLRTHVVLKTNFYEGVAYIGSFAGSEMIDAILAHGVAKSRPAALALSRLLMKQGHVLTTKGETGADFQDSAVVFYVFPEAPTRSRSVSSSVTPVGPSKAERRRDIKHKEREAMKSLEKELKEAKRMRKEQAVRERERQRSLQLQLKEEKKKDREVKKAKGGGKKGPDPAKFRDFLGLLLNPNCVLVRAICSELPPLEADLLSGSLLNVYQAFGATDLLVEVVIDTELSKTLHPGTLFRGNSLASKVLTAYSRATGIDFLKTVFVDILKELDGAPTYEVDPSKLAEGDDLVTNLERLSLLFQRIFDLIVDAEFIVPSPIKLVCSELYRRSNDKFAESAHFAVGGYFFLRYLGPILVTPDVFGLVSQPCAPPVRRALLLVSKVLQSLSNGVTFGVKEEFMMPLNHLLLSNRDKLANFIEKLSQPNPTSSSLEHGHLRPGSCEFDDAVGHIDFHQAAKLARSVSANFPKVSAILPHLLEASHVEPLIGSRSYAEETMAALVPILPSEPSMS